jgi:hypothetical protein
MLGICQDINGAAGPRMAWLRSVPMGNNKIGAKAIYAGKSMSRFDLRLNLDKWQSHQQLFEIAGIDGKGADDADPGRRGCTATNAGHIAWRV